MLGSSFRDSPSTASNTAAPRCPWGGIGGGLQGLEIFPAYQAGGGVVGGVHHLADFFAGHSHELVAEFDFAGGQLVAIGVGHAQTVSALWTLVEIYFLHCILFFLR